MPKQSNVPEQLSELGVRPGRCLLVWGETTGNQAALITMVEMLFTTIGSTGTLVASSGVSEPDEISTFLKGLPGAAVSDHPVLPYVAVGENAPFLTANAPLHFPFGSNSLIARLHQLDGHMLVLNGDFRGNPAIHLAEVWADVPYAGLPSVVADGEGNTLTIQGFPGCGWGYNKIERVLRQARILREGCILGIGCQLMRIQHVASIAGEMLKGDPGCLLCDRPGCAFCEHARTLTRRQGEPAPEKRIELEDLP